jgi:hypothetical protein
MAGRGVARSGVRGALRGRRRCPGVRARRSQRGTWNGSKRPDAPTTPKTPQTAGASRDFRLVVTPPAYGTNNAIGTAADAASTDRTQLPDGHVTPDVLLRWVHQFSFVKLSASVDGQRRSLLHPQRQDSVRSTHGDPMIWRQRQFDSGSHWRAMPRRAGCYRLPRSPNWSARLRRCCSGPS